MIKVEFYYYSKILKQEFINDEIHESIENAQLRALALNWQIMNMEVL